MEDEEEKQRPVEIFGSLVRMGSITWQYLLDETAMDGRGDTERQT